MTTSGDISGSPYNNVAAYTSQFRTTVAAWLGVPASRIGEISMRPGSVITDFTIMDGTATWAPTARLTSDDDGLNTGEIVAIVLCCVIGCVLIAALLVWYLGAGRRAQSGRQIPDKDMSPGAYGSPTAMVGRDARGNPLEEMGLQYQSPKSPPQSVVPAAARSLQAPTQSAPVPGGMHAVSRGFSSLPSGAGSPPRAEYVAHVGDLVEAQYIDGAWYPAQVTDSAADGTYGLTWDDGSYSQDVPLHQLRPRM